MNMQKKLSLLALAVALLIASVPANAQQLYRGTFNLPFDAQFGGTIVEAGQYTIVLEQALGQKLIRLYGEGNGAHSSFAILTGAFDRVKSEDRSVLRFEDVNGMPALKTFEAGIIGESFTFPMPKTKGVRGARTDVNSSTAVVVATH